MEFLTREELQTIENQQFFEIKKNVTTKIYQAFGDLIMELKKHPSHLSFQYPKGADISVGKISKGENYLGLPYIMADFPRHFTKQGVFAYRLWFWWGNYITITWHLSGTYLFEYKKILIDNFRNFQNQDCFLAINDDEWQHNIQKSSYITLKDVTFSQYEGYINNKQFFKVSKQVHFNELATLNSSVKQLFETIIQ